MEVRLKILTLFLFLATIAWAQGVTDTCDYLEGGVLERQMQTGITGLLRGSGYCIQRTTVNGGLEMVGATLSVIDGDTVGQVLRWTGTDWETRLIIFPASTGGVDTVYNGLTDRDTAFVLGGPLTEHTRVHGQKTYDLTLDDMRAIYIEAQRTSGVAFSSLAMGSTAVAGIDFAHYNEADAQKQALAAVNYSTGNVLRVQNSTSNGTYLNQYDAGAGLYQTDIYASNGTDAKTIRVNRDAIYLRYLEAQDITHETAFVMTDTFTGELRYKSPADFAGLYGDDWGSQTVVASSPLSGVGTSGSPIVVSDASAVSSGVVNTTAQTMAGLKTFSGGVVGQSTSSFAALDAGGVFDANYVVVTSNATLDHTYNFVAIGTLSNNRTMSLPACNSTRDGWEYRFLKIGSDIYTVTIDPNGSETFHDGALTKVFDGQGSGAFCKCRWNGSVGTWFHSQSFAPSTVVTIPYGSTPTTGQVLKWSGTAWTPGTDNNDITAEPTTQVVYGTGSGVDSDTFFVATSAKTVGIKVPDSTGTSAIDTKSLRYQVGGNTRAWIGYQRPNSDVLNLGSGTIGVVAPNGRQVELTHYQYGSTLRAKGENSYLLEMFLGDDIPANFGAYPTLSVRGYTLEKGAQIQARDEDDVHGVGVDYGLKNNPKIRTWSGAGYPAAKLTIQNDRDTGSISFSTKYNVGSSVTEKMIILPNGTVGIGTTTPSTNYILDVNDQALVRNRLEVGGVSGTNATVYANVVAKDSGSKAAQLFGHYNGSYNTGLWGNIYDAATGKMYFGDASSGSYDANNSIAMSRQGSGATFFGVATDNPAQKFHVQGTARITGSDGTATGFMGRDADGDISAIGVGAGIALSGGNAQADIGSGLNFSGNDIAWGGTLTENTTVDFDTYDVFFTNMPTSTTEDEALVIDSGTGKLAKGQIPYTALRNPGEATYLGDNGATGETVSWQPEDILVEADPTAGHLTVELNTSMKQGLAYSLFGCCNLTYNITLNSGTMKITGSYGTTTSYVLGAGEHLEVIRMSTNTFYVSKK